MGNIIYTIIILIVLFNQQFVSAQPRGVKLVDDPQSFSRSTKLVVVGVSKYQNVPSLSYAHTDAQSFYNFMTSPTGGRIEQVNTRILINEQATAANIWATVSWLLDETKEGETVIFYFAGHGDLERKTLTQPGFLLATDAPKTMYPAGGALGVYYLQDCINTIVQKNKARVILITDACHSGKLAGGLEGVTNTATAMQAQWENTIKILSSQPGELSQEGTQWNGGGGVFTYYLVKGLMGFADRNRDGKITVQEISIYLMENVPKETNFSQNPSVTGDQKAILAVYDTAAYASIKNMEQNLVIDNKLIARRGFEDEYKKTLDSATYNEYTKFRYCIENNFLLIDENQYHTCAWEIYQKLKDKTNALPIINNIKYSLLATLQENYQNFVNYFINNGGYLEGREYARENRDIIVRELEKTIIIVDSTYLLYDHLKASYLAMKAFSAGFNVEVNIQDFIPTIDEAINLEPDNAFFYFIKGLILRRIDGNNAIKDLEKAYELSPKCSLVTYFLGVTFDRIRDYENAIVYYDKTITIDSTNLYAFLGLANNYNTLKQNEKAKYFCEKVIALSSGISDPYLYYDIGNIYKDEKNKEKAYIYYAKAIQLYLAYVSKEPDNNNYYYDLACCYSLIENKEEVLKYLELAFQKGWKKLKHIEEDTDLDYIRNTPEFKTLMKKYSNK